MKVATTTAAGTPQPVQPANEVSLPAGLIGFPDHRRMELVYVPDQLPFLWMHLKGPDPLNFVVVEPKGVVSDYEPEIFDEDAAALGINGPDDAMVLNIVCLDQAHPEKATVNLVGPVVINRRSGVGRQVVLANHGRYSARHPLLSQTAANGVA